MPIGRDAAPDSIPMNGPAERWQQASRRTARKDSDERYIICSKLGGECHCSEEGKAISEATVGEITTEHSRPRDDVLVRDAIKE